uniref:Lysosome-associated membrane glycoprotein 2-like transmembrane domain-containing protein n=1 Tax=Timema douglasi TaxID=61478 RepID=A0A7R8VFP1_TIMDO|nr:unnamed protein product [Timema douglasi]
MGAWLFARHHPQNYLCLSNTDSDIVGVCATTHADIGANNDIGASADTDNIDLTALHLASYSPEFNTPVSMSYRCMKKQLLNLTMAQGNTTVATLEISNTQFEAFHDKTDTVFGVAEDCEPPSSPDVVPIAVGCALVALVAIVLVAYLIGRRRSQARGYISM